MTDTSLLNYFFFSIFKSKKISFPTGKVELKSEMDDETIDTDVFYTKSL